MSGKSYWNTRSPAKPARVKQVEAAALRLNVNLVETDQ